MSPLTTLKTGLSGFPILHGEHSPQNVALYAFTLGACTGLAMGLSWMDYVSCAWGGYFALVSLGMVLEYISRAIMKQEEGLRSFLLPGSAWENALLLLGPVELAIEQSLFGRFASIPTVTSIGVLLAIFAQNIRTISLLELSGNPENRSAAKRAELALSVWRVAVQVVLCNPLCLAAYFMSETPAGSEPQPAQPEMAFGPFGLPIFDGEHTPQNIAAYAYLLGCAHGFGVAVGLVSPNIPGLGFFIAMLALFHTLEYICTAMYRTDVKMSSFLLNQSREYHLAMTAGIVEYLAWYLIFPSLKIFHWWNWLALYGVAASQTLRSAAMITAGSNFTHIVAEEKHSTHTLVTNGIYSVFRHPSYTGFFYWGVCMQILLANPICTLGYTAALWRFFHDRIADEELTLLRFFGSDYEEFRSKTKVFIPFIA
ncbi:hypothetical protein, variant [Spizellomyces punctatus DAOM BR117]|uniref:Protein-S-isoprenylcysteine O-methyltransferase n=1 Tax=Spizellomyces punctatus (strain DAOM BR117) TaxID=645134 RepID=A0A0L0HHM2_SPIPD|nr:hypothetical protein, variant [Spizellomyces punctatus DAOM BR117]KND00971.1 hypothetical protein, variant [Spizellomyces punctatus DAOM BR117]|eukprot:XP_016609010.1 hypothetical protein, variant [Spizellomyces punctatus DAOM BR117]